MTDFRRYEIDARSSDIGHVRGARHNYLRFPVLLPDTGPIFANISTGFLAKIKKDGHLVSLRPFVLNHLSRMKFGKGSDCYNGAYLTIQSAELGGDVDLVWPSGEMHIFQIVQISRA